MGMDLKDPLSYIGIGFKYIRKRDYFSLEAGSSFCRVRQMRDFE